MTSMYDEPGTGPNAGHWPGRERRRAATVDTPQVDVDLLAAEFAAAVSMRREQVDPQPVSTASTAATAYDWVELDPAGRAMIEALAARFGLDPANVSPIFHVGRTRRGYVLMLTEYDVDDQGKRVHVLGVPVVRHHLQPVGVDELPAACRAGR